MLDAHAVPGVSLFLSIEALPRFNPHGAGRGGFGNEMHENATIRTQMGRGGPRDGQRPTPVRIKICGLTNEADARFAAEAGADFLGFVFAPSSPRRIAPEALAAFAGRLPPGAKKVGVFVDAEAGEIEAVRKMCGLDVVQLHGHETRALAERLAAGGEVWKALALTGAEALDEASAFAGFTLLADNERGGAHRRCDHASARALASSARLFLAGGLDAGNVSEAIRAVRPYGVDAASGVESSPGVKDREKVRAFINAVKRSQER